MESEETEPSVKTSQKCEQLNTATSLNSKSTSALEEQKINLKKKNPLEVYTEVIRKTEMITEYNE